MEKYSSNNSYLMMEPSLHPEPGKEIAIYRIAQESLTNVQQDANATEVDISNFREGKNVKLIIRDNGKGFNPDEVQYGTDCTIWEPATLRTSACSKFQACRIASLPWKRFFFCRKRSKTIENSAVFY